MKAIILLSGGIDSSVMLAKALEKGRDCFALSFDYGQRHRIELESAKKIAAYYKVPHQIIEIVNPSFISSALVNKETKVQKNRTPQQIATAGIPSTYVPARNTIFLAYALSLAEHLQADEIHYGSNALDFVPYPDCRPDYFSAFQSVINLATKQSLEGAPPCLVTPLIYMNKAEIIAEGQRLNVPLEDTFSCYSPLPSHTACGQCDACILRIMAF